MIAIYFFLYTAGAVLGTNYTADQVKAMLKQAVGSKKTTGEANINAEVEEILTVYQTPSDENAGTTTKEPTAQSSSSSSPNYYKH